MTASDIRPSATVILCPNNALMPLSIRGLTPEQARELCRLYDDHDPIGAALSSSDLHGLRFVLAVTGWTEPERFTARIAAAGHHANDLTPQTKQFDAMFEELAESCILAACRDPVQFDSALLANGVAALSASWPATNTNFRTMFGNLVNGLRTTQWPEVWTASLTLRSRRD